MSIVTEMSSLPNYIIEISDICGEYTQLMFICITFKNDVGVESTQLRALLVSTEKSMVK